MNDLLKKHINILVLALLISTLFLGQRNIAAAFSDDLGAININGESFTVYTIHKSGNDNENFNLLFLGDGYIASEQNQFINDVLIRAERLLKEEPFRSYSHKLNIYAVPTVSNESGVSDVYGDKKDTYFNISHRVSTTSFTEDGEDKARAIKKALEEKYLDAGAVIGTIHVLSNSLEHFGSSTSALFSFASLNGLYNGGEASLHEIAHSIGRLKDEYGAVVEGANASRHNDSDIVQWKKLLGFRGVGIINNENSEIYFAPTRSCIMMNLDRGSFCEVCKTELVTRMNLGWYTQRPEEYYIAAPDVTIEHSPTSAIGSRYDACRINERNIESANGHSLELRTVIQNFKNIERHLTLSLEITDRNGNRKFYQEKAFTVAPLINEFYIDEARMSLSVVIEAVSGLCDGDRIYGRVTDSDSNTVVATDKTAAAIGRLKLHYKLKNADGSVTEMPYTYPATVYLPQGAIYRLNPPARLNGCVYVGSDTEKGEIKLEGESANVVFYYMKPADRVRTQTTVSDDGTYTIKLYNIETNSSVVLALFTDKTLNAVRHFTYNGSDIVYNAGRKYSAAKVMVLNNMKSFRPLCRAEAVSSNQIRD